MIYINSLLEKIFDLVKLPILLMAFPWASRVWCCFPQVSRFSNPQAVFFFRSFLLLVKLDSSVATFFCRKFGGLKLLGGQHFQLWNREYPSCHEIMGFLWKERDASVFKGICHVPRIFHANGRKKMSCSPSLSCSFDVCMYFEGVFGWH